MVEQSEKRLPYAPTKNVLDTIAVCRANPRIGFLDDDVLRLAQVPESSHHLVSHAFEFLGLMTSFGQLTTKCEALVNAESESDYRDRIEMIVRYAYAADFAEIDPETTSPEDLHDHFKQYRPKSATDRIRSLFTGLCAEAGLEVGGSRRLRSSSTAAIWLDDFFLRASESQDRSSLANLWRHVLFRSPSQVDFIVVPMSRSDIRQMDMGEFQQIWNSWGKLEYRRCFAATDAGGHMEANPERIESGAIPFEA